MTHDIKVNAIVERMKKLQWIGSARDICVHLRASAANFSSLRGPITFRSTPRRSCCEQQKKYLPQMHADARRCSGAVGSFEAIYYFFCGLCVKILALLRIPQAWRDRPLMAARYPCLHPNAIALP
ncbi:MAG TPA: hypothetical protein VMU81_14835 [Acetobacteraceae bacterium]|nr:hypothetical protein [Acetobacteraceae bacterium]